MINYIIAIIIKVDKESITHNTLKALIIAH